MHLQEQERPGLTSAPFENNSGRGLARLQPPEAVRQLHDEELQLLRGQGLPRSRVAEALLEGAMLLLLREATSSTV